MQAVRRYWLGCSRTSLGPARPVTWKRFALTSREEKKKLRQAQQQKIWKALNEKDEAERCSIATLISSVAKDLKPQKGVSEELNEEAENTSMNLPESLEDVQQLLRSFLHHQNADKAFVIQLMKKSREILEKEGNIIHLDPLQDTQRLHVVGDIHGDLEDLKAIFDVSGWPSKENLIVFNGDFVDRGNSGVEVICILLSLKLLFPSFVYILRGNHEDANLGKAYGFFDEVHRKYKSRSLYDAIEQCFSHLPLCAMIENGLFIAHGGIPRDKRTTIQDIESIPRAQYTEVLHKSDSLPKEEEKLRIILEDLLWSDPDVYEKGSRANHKRGAGSLFGTDFAQRWLKSINVQTLVRSHEMMEDGYEEIDCGDGIKIFTVFSSSNYSGGSNLGAVLRFTKENYSNPEVLQFEAPEPRSIHEMEEFNKNTLSQLIFKHSKDLKEEFDSHGTSPFVTLEQWNSALSQILRLDIEWEQAFDVDKFIEEGKIDYTKFLDEYVSEMGEESSKSLELFQKHNHLAAIFKLFDIEQDGEVSKREFITACNTLNHYLPKEQQANSVQLFEQADTNNSGSINYDEFCSLFQKKEPNK